MNSPEKQTTLNVIVSKFNKIDEDPVKMSTVWTEPFTAEIIRELQLEAAKRFRRHQLPSNAADWNRMRKALLPELKKKLALKIDRNLALDCRYTGTVECASHTIRQLCYQSRKDFYVTASLYIPKGKGPFPAVVNLHGHWNQGRLATSIQKIGHILAKSGYVVLSVDAFGSGERSSRHGEFEYHGGMMGGLLLNIGEPLMGIQIIDNMRAVDLLSSLDFVDPSRIGATGGSGGGNQTMYLAAFDERIRAAAPVVSVGSYQSYVGGTNCICELLPDGLDLCEESALLAMIAPRALKICNALHDCNPTFHVPEMARSYTEAKKVFTALGTPEKITTLAFDADHSYPPEVQSAVLGFFDFYLREQGHGMSAVLPEYETIPEEKMMAFPKGNRFAGVCSIPEYLERRAAELKKTANGTPGELREILRVREENIRLAVRLDKEDGWEKYSVETSRGRMLPFRVRQGRTSRWQILASPNGWNAPESAEILGEAVNSKDSLLVFDPWGCGECGYAEEMFPIPFKQHQLARSLIWLGRRLMGEWTMDYLRAAEFILARDPEASIRLRGYRDSGLAALYSAVLYPENIREVDMTDSPVCLVRREPRQTEEFMTMAICIPGILAWGDVEHAATLAKCKVNILRPRRADDTLLPSFP